MSWLLCYLIFGCGFYSGAACTNKDSFEGATKISIANDLIMGILLWPALIPLMLIKAKEW